MRVLYLAPDPPSPKGASVRIGLTVRTLRELGHEVETLLPAPVPPGETAPNFLDRMLSFRAEAERWLAGRKADAVQFRSIWEGIPALAWARRCGARAVFEVHGLPSVELRSHFPGIERSRVLDKILAEERALLRESDRVLTPSFTGERFLRMLGVPSGRISVVRNAVDCSLFSPAPAPPADAPPRRLLYQGTLAPWQGLGLLLEALVHLRASRTLELHIVGPGKGSWRRELLDKARRLRVRHMLRLCGPMGQADLVPVLRSAHVCLAPLVDDPRNSLQGCCPIKLLEYMAAGRPILSTRVPPVLEMLEHGADAYLAEPSSPLALADGLRWLLSHPAEREALGAAAREAALSRWDLPGFRRELAQALEAAGLPGPGSPVILEPR